MLSVTLGIPTFEIDRWPSRVVNEYAAYYLIEPWGPQRDNFHAAHIAHILANAHREPRSPAVPFDRYMWRDPVEAGQDREQRVVDSFRTKVVDDNAESG